MNKLKALLAVVGIFGVGYVVGSTQPLGAVDAAAAESESRVYEARLYTVHPGRLEALEQRFRDHTIRLFEKHGMTNVGYWVREDSTQLIFLLSYPSRAAAQESWRAFREDPEWQTARAASEADGPIVRQAESIYMSPTAYSPLK